MADLRQQRVSIRFCFKLGKTAAEMHQMLKQTSGDNIKSMLICFFYTEEIVHKELSLLVRHPMKSSIMMF
jgi:hypothetical protein